MSDGLKVDVDNTDASPYTHANVLHHHNFDCGFEKYQNVVFEPSSGGRERAVDACYCIE